MKIVRTKYSSLTGDLKIQMEESSRIFKTFLDTQLLLMSTVSKIQDFKNSETQTLDDGLDLVMATEELLNIDLEVIRRFDMLGMASTPSLRRRVNDFVNTFDHYSKMIDEASQLFIPYSEEDLSELEGGLENCIGYLACFLVYQFGLDNLLYEDTQDIIYDAVEFWRDKEKRTYEDVEKLAANMAELMLGFSRNIGAFEIYPDLLEPFTRAVGADVYDVDNVPISIITDVINGKMTAEQFQEYLEDSLS